MSLIRLENVTKLYDPDLILDDISVSIEHGDRIGLIGRNGTGKTTLIKIINGMLANFKGKVVSAKGLRIGYLSQEPDLARECTLRQEMLKVFERRRTLEDKMLLLAEEMETEEAPHLLEAYARIQEQHERLGGYDYEHQVNRILGGLGFPEQDFNLPIRVLSGGQKSRATLAKLLLEAPDLLLFDEPTNHLDIKGIEWLENYLNIEYNGAVLVVSHDRYFLDKVVRKVWELAEHKIKIYRGNYSKYAETKNVEKLVGERAFKKQQAFIEHEEDFIRRNIAGQRTREAQGRRKKLARLERVEKPKPDARTLKLNFTPETRGGNDILRCKNVGKAFGEKAIFKDLNFEVYRRDVIGIVGANGTGKTTLFRMILGEESATAGELWVGPTLKFGYYTQELEGLNPDNEIIDEIWELRPQQTQGEIRGFLGKFLFSGDDVFKRIGNLSGGEQSRVLLAKLLLANANVLLLDEPTNHLDIPAREALEAALAEYSATLFIISHDRYLLNNLATKLLIFDGTPGGTATLFEGNYAEYIAQQQANQQPNENIQEPECSQTSPQKSKSKSKSKSKRKRKIKAQRLVGSN
ncbi:MAG: ABC-F family ATP-binding cassette domain-containing protein [Candidatus Poribacteria bacterium]|nr:ABC-F family ATP-binding cassette domain-containing protein [Candidatus Poribacteria bacterium]